MTPAAIAENIAAYYREDPKWNWRQGSFGTRVIGCCLFSAARTICNRYELLDFEKAFARQSGHSLTTLVFFNDHVAKNVDDVLVVLDKVASTR